MSSFITLTEPRSVLFFSGHMIDARNCATPRFPADKEAIAASAIAAALDEFGVTPDDLGITKGGCGGDLLFAEAMLKRGARIELRLPMDEDSFIQEALAYDKGGSHDRWRERFLAVRQHPSVKVSILPTHLPTVSQRPSAYERCNLWMLQDAMAYGARRVRYICLWNGEIGAGLGDTYHMIREVRRRGGKVRWIDTGKLWRLPHSMMAYQTPEVSSL